MTKILGVDPGSRVTGYGIIERAGRKWTHIDNGVIAPSAKLPMAERLHVIYRGLVALVETHRPQAIALEKVFLDQNPQTAIKLGQARGLAMLVSAQYGIPLAEYTPLAVKQCVVGYGRATKEQVQEMIKRHFNLPEIACEDASDALAIALTYAGSLRAGVAGVLEGRTPCAPTGDPRRGARRAPSSWRDYKVKERA